MGDGWRDGSVNSITMFSYSEGSKQCINLPFLISQKRINQAILTNKNGWKLHIVQKTICWRVTFSQLHGEWLRLNSTYSENL